MPLTVPLAQSVVVVVGASSGLGAATALRLAERGCRLVLAARGTDNLLDIEQLCRQKGAEVLTISVDTADGPAVADLASRAEARFGRIDAWIANAAVADYGRLIDLPVSEVERVLAVNLIGPLHGLRAASPRMRRVGGGVIVLVGSVLAETSMPYQGAYTIAKHGLLGLAGSFRQELLAMPCPEVSICVALPGFIDTPLFEHAGNHTGRRPRPLPPTAPVSRVAERVVGLLESPRPRSYLGWAARMTGWAARTAPTGTERCLALLGQRQFVGDSRVAHGSGNLYRPSPVGVKVHGGWRRVKLASGLVGGVVAAAVAYGLSRR